MKDNFTETTLRLDMGQLERLKKLTQADGESIDVQVRAALEVYCEIVEGKTLELAAERLVSAHKKIEELEKALVNKHEIIETQNNTLH